MYVFADISSITSTLTTQHHLHKFNLRGFSCDFRRCSDFTVSRRRAQSCSKKLSKNRERERGHVVAAATTWLQLGQGECRVHFRRGLFFFRCRVGHVPAVLSFGLTRKRESLSDFVLLAIENAVELITQDAITSR